MISINTYKIKLNIKRPVSKEQTYDQIPVLFPDYKPVQVQPKQKRVNKNKSRRKSYVYAIVAAVFICVVLSVGILTTIMLSGYEPVVPVSGTDTTIFDEQIHSIEFEIVNAVYCHGCMTEQDNEIKNVDETKKNVCKSVIKEIICLICKSGTDEEAAI